MSNVLLPRESFKGKVPRTKFDRQTITRKDAKKGARSERKAEAFTVNPIQSRPAGATRLKGKAMRKVKESQLRNIMAHQWDRDLISTEVGHNPLLPKRATNDAGYPRCSRMKPARMSTANFQVIQHNPWKETEYMTRINVRGASRVAAVPYQEQPLEGAQKLNNHVFQPNPPYGGTHFNSG